MNNAKTWVVCILITFILLFLMGNSNSVPENQNGRYQIMAATIQRDNITIFIMDTRTSEVHIFIETVGGYKAWKIQPSFQGF